MKMKTILLFSILFIAQMISAPMGRAEETFVRMTNVADKQTYVTGVTYSFEGEKSDDIKKVEIIVDTFSLGFAQISDQRFTLSYAFAGIGSGRKFKVIGYDENGKQVASAFYSINVVRGLTLKLNNLSNNQSFAINREYVLRGITSSHIRKITLFYNGQAIGDASINGEEFSFSYAFREKAEGARLELVGYDGVGSKLIGGTYWINVIEPAQFEGRYFNEYILKAVDELYAKYRLLGYDINSVLTHDIQYHTYGTIKATNGPLTMCVAAQMEIILTAYQVYADETGDYQVYDYLPKRSFERLSINDLKGHIWVNHKFNSSGTADALINFGMGERTPFEELTPGSFVNINRSNGTGHAVTFIHYINIKGEPVEKYGPSVVGFKYFSSQGKRNDGGLDYRYAVFKDFGCPEMPYKRDCGVILSNDQNLLNTGRMLNPKNWRRLPTMISDDFDQSKEQLPDTVLDKWYFNGLTTDD